MVIILNMWIQFLRGYLTNPHRRQVFNTGRLATISAKEKAAIRMKAVLPCTYPDTGVHDMSRKTILIAAALMFLPGLVLASCPVPPIAIDLS